MRLAHERNAASEGRFFFPSNMFNEPEHDGGTNNSETFSRKSRGSGSVGCGANGGGSERAGAISGSGKGELGGATGEVDNGGVYRPRDVDPHSELEGMTVLQILGGKVDGVENMF